MNYPAHLSCLLITVLLLTNSMPVDAEDTANSMTKLEVDLVGLYNPLGISISANGYYRQVYHRDDSPLWDGLFWQAGGQVAVTPAYQRGGIHFEWLPIAVIQMSAQYDRYYFTGSYGSLLAFDSTDERFGDDEIKSREGQEQSGYGNRYLFNLTLRAKFGNTIIRNVTDMAKYEFPGEGPYYLEQEYDLLMATTDYLFSNQFYLLYENKDGRGKTSYFGPYYDYVKIRETGLVRERLGLTWYQERDRAIGVLQKPRWYVQSGIYLTERNRQDEFYLVVGVGGDFDF